MTFAERPASSGTYGFTDSRFDDGAARVNFYLSYFNNQGTARDGLNLSPASDTLDLTAAGGRLMATLRSLTMTNETDAGDTFTLTGSFDLPW